MKVTDVWIVMLEILVQRMKTLLTMLESDVGRLILDNLLQL